MFEKGYLPNWSEAVYKIAKVNHTSPVTYIVRDPSGEVLEGGFYTEELKKTNQDVYRIEKVLKTKKFKGVQHALVKWSGYSEKQNSSIPVAHLEKLA